MNFKNRFFLFFILLSAPVFCFSQTEHNNDSSLIYLIRSHGIYDDDFIRNTFYTWTTTEQINDLRTNKKLLTKSRSETKGYSLYDMTLRDSVLKGLPVIQLLKQEQFAKKRFAWTSCWPTALGMEYEKYGDQLVKIVLKDNSIIGKFDILNLADPIQFFNLKGDTLNANYAIENQDRIAVIYHINSIKVKRTQAQMKRRGTFYQYVGRYKKEDWDIEYREFVVMNEHMITWSYGTEDIKNEISSEINYLKQLQSSGRANQAGYKEDCDLIKKGNIYDDVYCDFESNKCFNTDYYLFNNKQLQKIIDQLQLVLMQQSAPIVK